MIRNEVCVLCSNPADSLKKDFRFNGHYISGLKWNAILRSDHWNFVELQPHAVCHKPDLIVADAHEPRCVRRFRDTPDDLIINFSGDLPWHQLAFNPLVEFQHELMRVMEFAGNGPNRIDAGPVRNVTGVAANHINDNR